MISEFSKTSRQLNAKSTSSNRLTDGDFEFETLSEKLHEINDQFTQKLNLFQRNTKDYQLHFNFLCVSVRVCVVESLGNYRKAPKFCPLLKATSNIECVSGVDRLDCVRRIHKGTAHFGVLTSEDLVAARWASVEILVASELRSHQSPFEYEIVAVVNNDAGIHTVNDLHGAKLCHPGYGLDHHWTEVLANVRRCTFNLL